MEITAHWPLWTAFLSWARCTFKAALLCVASSNQSARNPSVCFFLVAHFHNPFPLVVQVESVWFDPVTILFSDIKDFTTICSRCKPEQVVSMLNNLYTRFDELTTRNNVYKVCLPYGQLICLSAVIRASRHWIEVKHKEKNCRMTGCLPK